MRKGKRKGIGRRILGVVLSVILTLGLLPEIPAVQAAENTTVTYEAIAGTKGVTDNENYDKLFDGKYGLFDYTKWCVPFSGSAYVIFKASEPVLINGYAFVTGNDNYYVGMWGRNPRNWTLYGCNNPQATEDSKDWKEIHSVKGDNVLQDVNLGRYDFAVTNPTTNYQYFMLKVTVNKGADVLQLCELIIDGTACEHVSKKVVSVTEPTCIEEGHTTYECNDCNKVYIDNIVEANGHKFDNNNICSECGIEKGIAVGDFYLPKAEGDEYTYSEGVLTIVKNGAELTISNIDQETSTTDRIVVKKDVSAKITLAGVNIDVSSMDGACAFKIEDGSTGDVMITLADDTKNVLKSGDSRAGLEKNGAEGTLTIGGGIEGTGSLTAESGYASAGIGGGSGASGSRITISGGTVKAIGSYNSAGIGGGSNSEGHNITISGGTVEAIGGARGAGIGGGLWCSGYKITISGGKVKATGGKWANTGEHAAGIGGGHGGSGYDISISGGTVEAIGNNGAGIGGGRGGSGSDIRISGGTVTAQAGYGAGIGGGWMAPGSKIYISGGIVTTTATSGAGIGGGYEGTGSDIRISGGSVKASVTFTSNAIGGGQSKDAVIPTLDGKTPVYLFEIANDSSANVVINDTDYPDTHGEEKKIYTYLPAKTDEDPNVVRIGEAVLHLYYDTKSGSRISTCEIHGDINKDCVCDICAGQYEHEDNNSDGYCDKCGYQPPVDSDGDGYYEIGNAVQLYWFSKYVAAGNKSANAELTADIDFKAWNFTERPWIPICQTASYHEKGATVTDTGYTGIFDGNGHTITGLTITGKSGATYSYGLFGTVSGTIKNLGMVNFVYTMGNAGDTRAGSVAGQLLTGGSITDCYSVGHSIATNNNIAGGIAGCNYGGTVSNCYAYNGTVTGYGERWGGVVGDCQDDGGADAGTVTNCYTDDTRVVSIQNKGTNITECYVKEDAAFASGEVCYRLNGSTIWGDLAWGQTLKTDTYPVFLTEDNIVCMSSGSGTYSNHNVFDADGLCISCGDYEKTPETDANGVYQISNATELCWFMKKVNGGKTTINAKLTADIDMKNVSWTTICETPLYYKAYGTGCDYGYRGTFDGNGHVISNLTVTSSAASVASVGLFGTVSGTIKNLGMKNFTLVDKGKDMRAGAIVGQLITANGKVSDCYVIGATIETGDNVAGGIAGCVYEGTVENCYVVDATISGAKGRFGYVTGDVCADGGNGDGTDRPGVVKNCFTNGAKISSDRKGTNSVVGGEAKVSAERFASGEIAYLLNDSTSTGNLTWYQKLDESADAYPVLDSTRGTVYLIYGCDEKTPVGYSNVNENETHEPEEDDGDCTTAILCSGCEVVLTEAKESHIDENGDDKCDNCESVLIGSITITGIDAPVGGKNFDTKADFTTADLNDAEVTIVWTKGSEPAGETADYATTYTAKITLAREKGTAFLDEVTATVNGKTATVILNDDGTITVTSDFTTATRKISSVQAPTVPERFSNAYTAEDILEACELGDTAKVTLEGEMEPNTVDMAVEWTLANPGGAEYASEIFKKNTFRWTVKAGEYEGYDVNAVSLTGTVTIENAYILEPVATSIPVRVYLQVPEGYEGTYNSKGEYMICLEQKTEAPMPVETPDRYVTADAGKVDFGEITFKKPGIYKYKVELQGEVTGVEKDENSSKDVNIEVTDNGDGTMNLSCDYTEESPLTFTNILRLTTAGIKVVWEDTENLDGIRPDSITAQLLADGESTGQSVVLNASNNWTAEIKELPQIAAGEDIVYTWSVGTPEGYTSSLIQEDTLVTLKYSHELTTKLEGRSVSLGEQIGMNFYMKLTQELLEDEEAYMLFTLPGGNTSKVMLSEAKQEIKDGEEYYVFTYEGAAKEMADIIKMQMFFGNGIKSGEEYSGSVKEYAEALLEGNVATDAEKKLTKAMLNYGAYAQLYFNYNTGMLANVGCQDADLICDLSYISAKPSIVDNSEVLDYAGSTLILESKIKVRHYFKVAEGQTYSGNLTKYVPMDGSAMNGDYYYYESDGIPTSELAITRMDAESVPGFEIYYSPLSYVITVIATNNESDLKDDIKLQNLMKALYLYSEAVEDCKREGE